MLGKKHTGWVAMSLAALVVALGLVACSESTEPSGTGTLRINLVDAPTAIKGTNAINVVFSSVLVHKNSDAEEADAGWITILGESLDETERTFNLLDLVNGAYAVLGEAELEAGEYTQIRIIIESATITVDGNTSNLFIPSGVQTGVKLVEGFTVDPNVITELTLDFDAGQSVVETPPGSDSYKLQPTIRLVQTVLSGTISGTVIPTGIDAMVLALEPSTGDTITTTYVDDETGAYVLQALLEGTYNVRASAQGYEDGTLTGITVTAGENSDGNDFTLSTGGEDQ